MPNTASLTAAQVMDRAASLMNDTVKDTYTFIAQIPYLNMALDELQEHFELNNIPVTNLSSAIINVAINKSEIIPFVTPPVTGEIYYPTDLIEIQGLWERLQGSSDSFVMVGSSEFLSHSLEGITYPSILSWIWSEQKIKFNPPTTAREVKLDYIKRLFVPITVSTDIIGIINSISYLAYKTAALCSWFIGENQTRADKLESLAILAMDRTIGISTKGRQATTTRRRPFMARYKSRGN